MNYLVVYDSQFGYTHRVTQIIADTLQITKMMHIDQAATEKIARHL